MTAIRLSVLFIFLQYFLQYIVFSSNSNNGPTTSNSETELIEKLFEKFGRATGNFIVVERSKNNNRQHFPEMFLDLISKTLFIHSANQPRFWSNLMLGAAHGIYEGKLEMGNNAHTLYYYLKTDAKGSTIVLALKKTQNTNQVATIAYK